MKPTPCRIVLYRISADDVESIADRCEVRPIPHHLALPKVGDELPMLIVSVRQQREYSPVSGHVFLDQEGTLFVADRLPGHGPGCWSWPQPAPPSAPIGVAYGDRI